MKFVLTMVVLSLGVFTGVIWACVGVGYADSESGNLESVMVVGGIVLLLIAVIISCLINECDIIDVER